MPEKTQREHLSLNTQRFHSLFIALESKFQRAVLIRFCHSKAQVEESVVSAWLRGQEPASTEEQEKIIRALEYLKPQSIESKTQDTTAPPVIERKIPNRSYFGLNDAQALVLNNIIGAFGTDHFTKEEVLKGMGYQPIDILPLMNKKFILPVGGKYKVRNDLVKKPKK